MLNFEIDTDVSLELMDPRHAEELFALTDANRAYLRQWMPWLDNIREVKHTRQFIELARRQLAGNNGFQMVIRVRGSLVGVLGHHGIDWDSRSTSLGYWLAESAQGQGLMTRSCRALIEHAFTIFALDRVEIRCAVENRKSRAIPERLGLRLERTLQKAEWLYDHFVDHALYAVHAADWPSREQPT